MLKQLSIHRHLGIPRFKSVGSRFSLCPVAFPSKGRTIPIAGSLPAREQPKMPRYYFDSWNGERVVPDHEGVECADDKAACGTAARTILDLASDIADGTSSC